MKITPDDIKNLFDLAMISTDEQKMAAISIHLLKIVENIEEIQSIDTEGVAPFYSKREGEMYLALDLPHKFGDGERLLSSFSNREDNFLVVDKGGGRRGGQN